MKIGLQLICFFVGCFFAQSQIIIDVNELNEPNPKLMDDIKQRKKHMIRLAFSTLTIMALMYLHPI